LNGGAVCSPRVAYICSLYPAVSHTFVQREIDALRDGGAEIATFSIHEAGAEHLLAAADREAFRTTHAILPVTALRLIATHLSLVLRAPRAYLSTLALALRLAPDLARGTIWQAFYFAEAVLLWRECSRRDIRHIHAHMGNVAADTAMLAAHLGGLVEPRRGWSWSLTLHGPDELFDVRHFRLTEKVLRAAFVVCISEYTRSQLMAICPVETWKKLHVVHAGIPVDDFTARGKKPAEDRPRVLFVGRLVPQKGHAVLLDAVALLRARGIETELLLAGEGPTRGQLEARAALLGVAEQTCFLGAVGQEEIRELYEEASVFCLPSFAEGLPTVLMEAMALELPVVSTRINGVPELVRDRETGLLVTPGRADELADAIQLLLEDQAFARHLAAAGAAAVHAEFDVWRCAAKLRALMAGAPGAGS
jgi:glycosyltransferase involved in cell wall biosynthesis